MDRTQDLQAAATQQFLHRVHDPDALAADQDHATAEGTSIQLLEELDSVHARHVEIAGDHVDRIWCRQQPSQGFISPARRANSEQAEALQHPGVQQQRERVVVEQEDAGLRIGVCCCGVRRTVAKLGWR